MTKEQVFKLIEKAISGVPAYFCDDQAPVLHDELRDAKLPFNWSAASGISKTVILIEGVNYVVKIPFTHLFDEDYYDDAFNEWQEERDNAFEKAWIEKKKRFGEDALLPSPVEVETLLNIELAPEPDCEYEYYCQPIIGATYCNGVQIPREQDWDYCSLETAIYQEALKRGLGQYFAEEGLLGYLQDGHPVYYQQRCVALCDSEEYDWNSEEYQRRSTSARQTCEKFNTYCFNAWWIADFVETYGEEEFKALSDFLREMQIDDLRDCNVGYLDGAPILFDYSGFRQWD